MLVSLLLLIAYSHSQEEIDDDRSNDGKAAVFVFVVAFIIVFLVSLFRFRLGSLKVQEYVWVYPQKGKSKKEKQALQKIAVKGDAAAQAQAKAGQQQMQKKQLRAEQGAAQQRQIEQPAMWQGKEIVLSQRAKQIEKSLSRFIIPESQLQNVKHLASGGFADVFTCDWNESRVAMKKLKPTLPPTELENFLVEIELMSKLRFPHLVGLIGCSFRPYYLIMPFLPRGTLHELLHDHRTPIEWKHIRQFSLHTAKGLLYMHSMKTPYTHRDIKSGNVLVDKDYTLKFADFGLSKPEDPDDFKPSHSILGTPPWMAPEIFNHKPYKRAADVYSYAIMMWEMLSRKVPYVGMNAMAIVNAVLMRKMRPDLSLVEVETPPEYVELMQQSWDQNPDLRPSMKEIIVRLNAMPLELAPPT